MDASTSKTEDSNRVGQADHINSLRSELVEVMDSTILICRALMRFSGTFSVVTIHSPASSTTMMMTSLVAVSLRCEWASADTTWEVPQWISSMVVTRKRRNREGILSQISAWWAEDSTTMTTSLTQDSVVWEAEWWWVAAIWEAVVASAVFNRAASEWAVAWENPSANRPSSRMANKRLWRERPPLIDKETKPLRSSRNSRIRVLVTPYKINISKMDRLAMSLTLASTILSR